jgi:hypothetical protein
MLNYKKLTFFKAWCPPASNAVLPEEQLEFEDVSPDMHQVTVGY